MNSWFSASSQLSSTLVTDQILPRFYLKYFTFLLLYIDCLDRTNVVQTAIAKSVLETQLLKLGLIPPEHGIPDDLRLVFQNLWANNGDALSKQYAGTNALKGDFTRTGERNLHGLMKDGKYSTPP